MEETYRITDKGRVAVAAADALEKQGFSPEEAWELAIVISDEAQEYGISGGPGVEDIQDMLDRNIIEIETELMDPELDDNNYDRLQLALEVVEMIQEWISA